jgi:hypothetical protein
MKYQTSTLSDFKKKYFKVQSLRAHLNVKTDLTGVNENSYQYQNSPKSLPMMRNTLRYRPPFLERFCSFPFVICSVSILVDTASSVLTPLKAG